VIVFGEHWEGALCDNRQGPGNRKSTRPRGRAVPAHRIAGMMATNISHVAPFRGIDFALTFIAAGRLNTRSILTSGKLDAAGFAKLGEIGYGGREASCRLLTSGCTWIANGPTSEGRQFRRTGEMGLLCPREPSPRIWTRNADKLRFWTENADMFGAPIAAIGFLARPANC